MIEQHNLPRGCSISFIRGRFEFDATLHEFCGIGEEGILDAFEQETGIIIHDCIAEMEMTWRI